MSVRAQPDAGIATHRGAASEAGDGGRHGRPAWAATDRPWPPSPGMEHAAAAGALRRATDHLLSLQDPAGWWKGELETNVTMDAEDLLLRRFLGILTPAVAADAARWIRGQQRADGTWATFFGGPPDLSTTVEAYVALRLAGDPAEAVHLRRAAEFIRQGGGVEASRVFTRIWLALFGLWPWDDLPALPPELVLLPPGAPFSIYDFGCWARQTVVALTVVWAHRPVRPLPLRHRRAAHGSARRTGTSVALPARRVPGP